MYWEELERWQRFGIGKIDRIAYKDNNKKWTRKKKKKTIIITQQNILRNEQNTKQSIQQLWRIMEKILIRIQSTDSLKNGKSKKLKN